MSLAWIPNAITLARMVMVWPLWLALAGDRHGWALAIAFVAGVSDALDGLLAKRFGWTSRLGGLLDPVADKLLLATAFIGLAWHGHLPVWLGGLVVGRDLVILGGATVWQLRFGRLEATPTLISKATTLAQIVLVLSVLAQLALGGAPAGWLLALIALVAALTVWSGLDYVVRWGAKARRASQERKR
jgi:cardiolipin synthase (CMP-forming)